MKKVILWSAALFCMNGALKSQVVTVTGGTSATYTSLGAAFAAINAGTHTGAITVDISTSLTETATAVLNSSGAGSANYTSVLIFPSVDGITVNGSGTAASGRGVIELNGADNVTIDGDNPNTTGINKNLTIVNNNVNTTTYASVIRVETSAIVPYDNANNITIKNLILNGNATSRNASGATSTTGSENTTFGVVAGPNGGSAPSALTSVTGLMAAGTTVNNLVVDNCSINQVGRAIVFNGNTSASSTGLVFTNNTIGGAGTLSGNPPYTSPVTTVYTKGIFIQGANAVTITGNLLQNILSYVTTTINGIELNTAIGTGNISISSNTLTGVVNNGSGAVNGIALSSSAGTYTIGNNIINNIQSSTSSVSGINISTSASSGVVESNKINYIYARSTGGFAARGILLGGGSNITVKNNFIWDLNAVANNSGTGTTFGVRGINITSGSNHKIYHNTISLSGAMLVGGSSADVTACLTISSSGLTGLDVRNNIFSNTMTGGNTGTNHTIIMLPGGATSAMNLQVNNNAYFGSSTVLLGLTTTPVTYSISNFVPSSTSPANNWRAYTSTLGNINNDNSSVATVAAAPFISASNLHINNASATFLESGGAVTSVTTDIDNDVRPGPIGSVNGGALAPDMGADEFDGILPPDVAAPVLASAGFTTNACSFTTRSFTANITDVSGVASGSLSPRVYFKVNNNAYTSVQGTMISGSATNGVWSFVLSYSAGNMDVISYYLVAQDVVGTPNILASPSAGFSATDVNNVTTPPTTPNSYVIASLGGVYTVGSTGTFTSLTQAANVYNQACLTSAVTFSLTDALYSAAETFPIVFSNNPDASSTNSLLIIPASGLNVSVIGSAAASSVVKFLNARNITVDGLNTGGSAITFSNSNSGASSVIWLASTTSTGPGNNTIGLKNITAIGGGTTSSSSFGIVAGVDGASPSTTSGLDNDNVTIQGNTILKTYYGIYANGTASVAAGGLDNWTISTNTIGPVSSGANNIGNSAVYLQNMLNVSVNSNYINNVVTTSANNGGVYLVGYINGATVSQNTITNLSTNSTSSYGGSAMSGVYVGISAINATILKNTISSMNNSATGGYGVRGIMISNGVASGNIKIENNMISDIYSYSDPAAAYWPIGIALEGASGGINIDNNTVSLFGSHTGLTSGTGSSPLYINTGSTGGLRIRDNIFSNTYDNSSSSTDIAYSIYSTVANTNFVAIDYNDYYVGGTGNVQTLGYLGGAQNSLANLQAAFGQNTNSKNIQPVFTSATDLHLIPANNVPLDNFGTPIAGITTDIDNQTRNASTPDMGADEFTSPVCTTANGGTLAVTTLTACEGQTVSLTSNGASTGVNTVYQWMYSTTAGGPYTVVSGGTGSNTTSYTTPTLSAGVYYAVLQAQCTSATLTAISNEATLTVNANPTVAVSPLSSTICMPGGSAVGLTATGGNNYTWTPSSGITGSGASVNAFPSSTTIYTVTGDNLAGCTSKTTTTVYIAQYPVLNPITASPSTVCVGGSSTLQAVASLSTYVVSSIPYAAIPVPGSGASTLCANGTASVPLTSGTLDDGGWANLALPFSFNFFGTNYNNFAISTNGFIFLGTGSPSTFSGYGNAFPSTSAAKPSIGVNYSDLDFDGVGSNSTIQYFTVGTSPNQQLVVRWSGQFWNNTGTVTTQAILYETSNVVEVHTFTSTGTNSGVLGIQNAAGNAAYVAPGRNAVTWAVSTPDAYRFAPSSVSYSWSPSTFLSSTSISNPVASNVTSAVVYSLTVIGSNGCNTTGTKTLSVDNPTISITGPTVSCSGSTIQLTASGANTYSWSTGSTSVTTSDAPTVNTTYSVTGTNSITGCSNTATQSVIVNSLPTVAVSGTSVICAGQTATLTASGASTYTWNTNANTMSITDAPTTTTSYTVNGTDANGCSNSAVQTVTVNSLPVVTITGTNNVCDGTSANLSGNGASTYSWSTGSTGSSIVVTPSVATSYTLTGIDNNNCSDTASFMVTVNPNPTVTVAGGAICPGASFTLAPSGATTYTYLPNGPVVSPGSTTTYTISGTDALGCVSQTAATAVITVTNNLSVTISGNTAVCAGQSASLTAGGAATYSWNTGAATSTVMLTPTVNTTYSVTGSSGSCSNTAVVTITVNALPTVSLSASSSTLCDNGQTVTLTGSPAGGVYSGSNMSGNIFTSTTAGTFTPVYSFTNSTTGCSNTANTSLVVSVCTGITKVSAGLTGLQVYPNPNLGEFTIELNNGMEKNIEVTDLTGRIILSSVSDKAVLNVNIANLANGVYFVKVQSNNSVEVVKVVKQ